MSGRWWFRHVACVAMGIALVSCGEKDRTPAWDAPADETRESGSRAEAARPDARASATSDSPADELQHRSPTSRGGSLRFIAYNVENWLTMDRYVDNKLHAGLPKPEPEKQAVIRLLAAQRPDVIGLCEIGTAADLAEIREDLKAAGIDLPHSHYTGGTDAVRHLGLLSRFPIVSTARPAVTEFRMGGRTYGINRGILDATVGVRGRSYRFIGVHLKSKRPINDADQEEMRIHEARLLRRHVDAIFSKQRDARLVVYGDFNDTRPSTTFKTITGTHDSPDYLTALPARDSRGHAWTHHWAPHDIYSRIDFITVSQSLRRELDLKASHIIDDPIWDQASDHRAILAIFR